MSIKSTTYPLKTLSKKFPKAPPKISAIANLVWLDNFLKISNQNKPIIKIIETKMKINCFPSSIEKAPPVFWTYVSHNKCFNISLEYPNGKYFSIKNFENWSAKKVNIIIIQ